MFSDLRRLRSKIAEKVVKSGGPPSAAEIASRLIVRHNCEVAVDVGCGVNSPLALVGDSVLKVGVDVDENSIATARQARLHDAYLQTNIMECSTDELKRDLLALSGGRPIEVILLFSVIEHLPKQKGFDLLNLCESITSKFVIVETPNGFVPQGPEFGNPYQRHLSGWFPVDFKGLGYNVYGTGGTNIVRGYMGEPRINLPGIALFDLMVLSKLLRIINRPRFAFNLLAIKDVRGVPARYNARAQRDN